MRWFIRCVSLQRTEEEAEALINQISSKITEKKNILGCTMSKLLKYAFYFVKNCTRDWTKQDMWGLHLGLWQTRVNNFHHFPNILWFYNNWQIGWRPKISFWFIFCSLDSTNSRKKLLQQTVQMPAAALCSRSVQQLCASRPEVCEDVSGGVTELHRRPPSADPWDRSDN